MQQTNNRHYKRHYYYLTTHSEQEKQQLLDELIHGNNLLGYPTYADIRKNRIRIKVLTPQLYPDAPPKLLGYLSG